MNAKYRSLLSALVSACALFAAPSAHAIVIKASDYPTGTNLTDAIPGVILQYATYNGSGPGFTTSPLVIGTDTIFSSGGPTQFHTFGGSTDGSGYPPYQIPSNEGGWDAIYIGFTIPVYSVTAVGFNEDDDPTEIVAYGQQTITGGDYGPLPYQCIPSPYPYASCLAFHEDTVSSTTPISYILVGGESETTYYTELDFPGLVPEPASSVLFGCGLMGVGMVILRRRRHSRNRV